jgi:hypothetical protein
VLVARAHPHEQPRAARSPRVRWALFCLGWFFFALGVLGTVLPVMPTTPFMLLALWAFSRSSERFHHWLRHHRIFGPPLQRWDRDRVIPLWAKVVAITSMAASLGWVTLVVRAPWYGVAAMAAVMLAGVAYITRFPSRSTRPASAPDAGGDAPR